MAKKRAAAHSRGIHAPDDDWARWQETAEAMGKSFNAWAVGWLREGFKYDRLLLREREEAEERSQREAEAAKAGKPRELTMDEINSINARARAQRARGFDFSPEQKARMGGSRDELSAGEREYLRELRNAQRWG